MTYSVDMTKQIAIEFSPATVVDEITQNIRTICSTASGSAAGARSIGIDMSMLDEPISIAKARLIGEIITAVSEQEPRATVTEVIVSQDHETGKLQPLVRYELAEGVQT